MPAGLRDLLDEEAPDLVGELGELLFREAVEVAGTVIPSSKDMPPAYGSVP